MNLSSILQASGRASSPADADAFEIRLPGNSHPFRLAYSAIRQLRTGLRDGQSASGLLLGSIEPSLVRIDQLLVLPEGSDGVDALRTLKATHEEGTGSETVLGFFRTQTSGWLEVRDVDRDAAAKCFSSPLTLFLTVQTPEHRPWSAVLLDLGPDGEPRSRGQEFFFDEYLLRNGYSNASLVVPDEEQVRRNKARHQKISRLWPLVAAVGLVLGVLTGAYTAVRDLRATQHSVTSPTVFALQITRVGSDFIIDWDRKARVLATATGGELTIQDGTLERVVEMSPQQLNEGRLMYSPVNSEVAVRLQVTTPKETLAESVQRISWDPNRAGADAAAPPRSPYTSASTTGKPAVPRPATSSIPPKTDPAKTEKLPALLPASPIDQTAPPAASGSAPTAAEGNASRSDAPQPEAIVDDTNAAP